jgi:hypothetical protein
MKLNKTITIKPPKYTDDKTKKIIDPQPIHTDLLDVTYIHNPLKRQFYASISGIPISIALWFDDEYIKHQADLANSKQAEDRLRLIIGENPEKFLQKLFPPTLENDPLGPGSILHDMISAIGIKTTPSCPCVKHAIEMNEKGIEWCENNIDTIVGWLKEESNRRKILFIDTIARSIVKRAIKKSKRYRNKK